MNSEQIEQILSGAFGKAVTLHEQTILSGGSVSEAFKLETSHGAFFLKVNSAASHPSLFEAEALGLKQLSESKAVLIPGMIATGQVDDTTYLILEFIQETPCSEAYWRTLGSHVAELHKSTASTFGADQDNYIGSLEQCNRQHEDWTEFYVSERLEPLAKKARDRNGLEAADALRFERLFNKLDLLIPKEVPALLHGDLWSGNHICGKNYTPYLIDPAVYFGHREMDIAMTSLFGGFDPIFYRSYNRDLALEPGWEERSKIHQLYPLLVHLILFGGSYASQIRNTLKHLA